MMKAVGAHWAERKANDGAFELLSWSITESYSPAFPVHHPFNLLHLPWFPAPSTKPREARQHSAG